VPEGSGGSQRLDGVRLRVILGSTEPHTTESGRRNTFMTSCRTSGTLAKKKTKVYLASDALTATKAAALTSNRSESDVQAHLWSGKHGADVAGSHPEAFGYRCTGKRSSPLRSSDHQLTRWHFLTSDLLGREMSATVGLISEPAEAKDAHHQLHPYSRHA
jgi:hypothetical protein